LVRSAGNLVVVHCSHTAPVGAAYFAADQNMGMVECFRSFARGLDWNRGLGLAC